METVKSADGTTIAYDVLGEGPPLVVVNGAFGDRKTPRALAETLSSAFTVYVYDRRGRGDSGDTMPYAPEREIEDLAAVIDAAGGTAHVFGHSSGACLALVAAADGVPIARLVAYEPPYLVPGTRPITPGLGDRVRALIEAGNTVEAVRLFLADAILMPPEATASIEHWPDWPGMSKIAHTLPYDLEIAGEVGVPVEMLGKIAVPTLILGGGNSPDWFRTSMIDVTAAIPGAKRQEMPGQDHGAGADVLEPILIDFLKPSVS